MTDPANSNRPLRQSHTLLLATDSKNSVLVEVADGKANSIAYSVYGEQSGRQEISGRLGFNGELHERRFGWYLLGNGYRAYNPVLMRFHSPDSLSPFGKGGLNPYIYCVGDPVNFSDPTGHIRFRLFSLRGGSQLGSAPSTSSLTSLIPDPTQTRSMAAPTTTPARKHSDVTTRNLSDHATQNGAPPPIPPKKQIPRFNDSGGQVGIISPNWKPSEPRRYSEIWKSEPFQYPVAPVPPTRTLKGGATRHYYVTYDANGNPLQSSVEKVDLHQLQEKIKKLRD